jgi:hypothetical protein
MTSEYNANTCEYSLYTNVTTVAKFPTGTNGSVLVDNGTDVEEAKPGIDGDVLKIADATKTVKFGNVPISGGDSVLTTPTAGIRIDTASIYYSIFNPVLLELSETEKPDYLYIPYGRLGPTDVSSGYSPMYIEKVHLEVSRETTWSYTGGRNTACTLGKLNKTTGAFTATDFGGGPHFTLNSTNPGTTANPYKYTAPTDSFEVFRGDLISLQTVSNYDPGSLIILTFIWLKSGYN